MEGWRSLKVVVVGSGCGDRSDRCDTEIIDLVCVDVNGMVFKEPIVNITLLGRV